MPITGEPRMLETLIKIEALLPRLHPHDKNDRAARRARLKDDDYEDSRH